MARILRQPNEVEDFTSLNRMEYGMRGFIVKKKRNVCCYSEDLGAFVFVSVFEEKFFIVLVERPIPTCLWYQFCVVIRNDMCLDGYGSLYSDQ